jgi:hypothetical protein
MAAEKYKAAWNPETHQGRIRLETSGGEKVMLELDDPAEFTAVLTILATSDEVRMRDGFIQTGSEAIGDD